MPIRFVIAAFGLLCLLVPTVSAQNYMFTDITYAGSEDTYANKINDDGRIAGFFLAPTNSDGFIYKNGVMHYVTFPQASSTAATDINNRGQISGYYNGSNCNNEDRVCGFIQSSGVFQIVRFPAAYTTYMEAIDDSGEAIGTYYDGTGNRSFIWKNGHMFRIDYPGASDTQAIGINNLGQIVGNWSTFPTEVGGGFLYDHGKWTSLTGPGGVWALIGGINDFGDFVGGYATSDGNWHGFANTAGVYTTLDYPGATRTFALGINNAGEIVGYYTGSGCFEACGFLAQPATNSATSRYK